MKKLLVITFVITLVLICTSALALDGKSGPYSYTVKKNGDLCITAFDWDAYGDEDVYIPKMINGYSVTEIGDLAFSEGYSKNVAVIIPDTIVTIGEKAFFETNITAIHIPSSVKLIGEGAFAGCKKIKQFSVDSSNPRYAQIDGVLYNKSDKTLLAFPHIYNENSVLSTARMNFSIPNGITSIAPYAFYKCYIGTIQIPSTLVSIGHHAFESSWICGIGKDKNIILSSILTIGEGAFKNCKYASRSTLERDNTSFHLFLEESKLEEIPKECFKDINIHTIILPDSLITINDNAFSNERGDNFVGDLVFPSSLVSIHKNAFTGCSIDPVFSANSSLRIIDDNAFNNALGIVDSLKLPEKLETIGNSAFMNNKYLNKIILPTSVKSIGDNFCDRREVSIEAEEGSFAYIWTVENGYTLTNNNNDTSWLND